MKFKIILPVAVVIVISVITGIYLIQKKSPAVLGQSSLLSQSQFSVYSLNQVSQHNTASDCWMVIDSQVYNVTTYIPLHPNRGIIRGCGQDATQMFNSVGQHSGRATDILNEFKIGTL